MNLCHECVIGYWNSPECPQCGNIPQEVKDEAGEERTEESTPDSDEEDREWDFDYERYGDDWQEIRKEVLERDNFECQKCGISDTEHKERDDLWPPWGGLHVHHIIPFEEFEEREEANHLSNLTALCASCHAKHEPK